MATAPIYCTHKELKRVYPQIDAFDAKTPIYGWAIGLTDWTDSVLDIYYANNTGLITELFWDGVKTDKITYNTTATSTANSNITASGTSVAVSDSSVFAAGDIIKINNEYMKVTTITNDDPDKVNFATPATNRGLFGTTVAFHSSSSSIYKIIDESIDIPDASAASDSPAWVYDPDMDLCMMVIDSKDPNDHLVESGEDYSTLITRITKNASRYFDSRVDATLPRDQWKDKEGNYDYFVVRTTALISAAFLLKSQDPLNPMIDKFEEEYNLNLGLLNGGQVRLSNQNTADSSQGVIRDVVYTSGAVRPVDTRGNWHGTYDMIKVKIITGGAMGAATFSAWVKNSDKLGIKEGTQVVTEQIINGDYQTLSGGLQIRFGFQASNALASVNNEWEIEVWGAGETVDNPVVRSVKMTRGWSPNRYR